MIESVAMLSIGALSMIVLGLGGRTVAKRFVQEEMSPYVGFSLAIGAYVSGGFRGINTSSDYERLALAVGMTLGLIFLWYNFFKRKIVKD